MVQKYHRVWSLLMAVFLLCSSVMPPLSIRVGATTLDNDILLSQDVTDEPAGETEADPAEETEEDPTEETEADPTEEAEEESTEETEADPTEEAEEESTEETEEAPTEETVEDPAEKTADVPTEEINAIAEEELVSVEPDHTGYPLIPGMQEHMLTKPGSDYKTVTPSLSFFAYLDLELFEGSEIDHINVYANRVAAADDNQYMTVSVVDSATAAVVTEHRFYARAEALSDFTTGQLLSLYPEEGTSVTVAEGQTLGFGKNGDPLVCNFQNDSNVPASLKGFYMRSGFSAGTAGGCLCIDVYAREAPQTSERDAALTRALAGKKLSILGDSISTFQGYSNSTAVNNTLGSNEVFYNTSKAPWSVLQTWWQQAADRYGMEILVNNAWSGSTVATYSGKNTASFGWNTRPDNLHDNTGTIVNPDIIAIYMGANDLSFEIPCDPNALTDEFFAGIEAEGYAPAEVTELHEAAALMVYKVRRNYPNAAIYLFTIPAMKNGDTYRVAYNQVLALLAQRYGCTLVDLYGSALSEYASYTTDGVHPNSAGMDVMTEVFAEALYQKYLSHTEHTWVTVPGIPATFRNPGLTDGVKCAECGEILVTQEEIPALDYEPRMFRWTLNEDGSVLVSQSATLLTDNALTLETGSITGGTFSKVQLSLADPLELRHDHLWSIEWRSSGTWAANSLLFSTEKVNTAAGNVFIYRPSAFVALGTYTGSFQNYTVSLSGYNTAVAHTYRLANRISDDGSNMVYLSVDGTEIGPLNQHYVANSSQNTTSDWVSGQDFRFRYIGAVGHPVSGSGLQYLLVNEGIDHSEHTEVILPGKDATLTESGLTEGIQCSQCGQLLQPQQTIPALRESLLESALMGKKLSILGDGISTFQGYSNSTAVNDTLSSNAVWYTTSNLTSVNDTWWKQAADRYGMQVLVNNSWSGSTVTGGEDSSGWNTRPQNLHDNTGTTVSPDLIAVYMGANDLAAGVPCGTATLDETFYEKIEAADFIPSADANFEESAARMVYQVVTGYPDAAVFLFNNPAMSGGTAADREAYNRVFLQLADHYGCALVDLYGSSVSDYGTYTSDGIHPNAAGMDVMTEVFADALYERFIADPEAPSAATEKGVYLSDLNYIPSGTNVGSGGYKKDSSASGDKIQLRVDGSTVTYDKGIGAHAPSTVTFNIAQYNQDYPRLCAKLGVDARQGSKGNVSFQILGSNTLTGYSDNTGWTVLLTTDPLTAASAAVEVDLDVSGYRYLRLYADHLGATGNDHSVYADARLIKADYNIDSEYFSRLHSLEWYNEQLSQYSYSYNLENNLTLIQEREFVSRIGLAVIQSSVKNSDTMADTLTWLLDDQDALQLFLETGNINFPSNTLTALDTLYTNYKDILGNTGDGYVYKKILIALAINWANDRTLTPYAFGGGIFGSSTWYFDIVERFRAAKWIYDEGELMYSKQMYARYNMELMRILVGDYIGLDEVQWAQHYGAKKYPNNSAWRTGPYRFMAYVHPPYYAREEYFTEETWTAYDTKYDLTEFNLLRSEADNKVYRMWMVYEAGGICWNISRIGTTLNKSYGIPSVGTFQPGHEAYFTYSENESGQGLWSIGNNVGGWACAYNNWGGTTTRMPLNWGSGTLYSSKTKNSSTYILLAQGALNQYDALWRSTYLNMLADAYDSPEKKLEIYQASLNVLDLNLDTYLDIIAQYIVLGDAVSAETWRDLAFAIIDAYTYYPVPMVDLVDAITPYCGNYGTNVISAKTAALNRARVATAEESLQNSACITLANAMLGNATDDVLATFSFDGENAGCIVLGESYEQYAFQLQYSLDGGETWLTYEKDVDSSRIIRLTEDQVAALHPDTDILMYISGMNVEGEDPDYFTIDILAGAAPVVDRANAATQINIHDGENWIVGKTKALEYSTDEGETWTAYAPESTRFSGNQTIQVRYAAHSTSLLGPATTLTFTDTNETDTFRHISVGKVELVRDNDTTYYEGRKGNLAIDANPFTGWHSENNQLDENKQLVVAFDQPRQLAGITYKSAGQNGRFLGVQVYVSLDGDSWTLAGSASGWTNDDTMKTLVLENSVPAKYVKLQATTNNGYICAQDIDFFEDTTKEVTIASIVYSTTAPTNGDVTASLMLLEGYTAIGADSHVFTENGEFQFQYADADGVVYDLSAKVTWIDKTAPTAAVTYSTTEITADPVTVTIIPSENVTVTNNGGAMTYIFTESGEFTFRIVDAAGNTAAIPVRVDWIRPVDRAAAFSFDGDNAGQILLDVFYASRAAEVTYSLDGSITWQTPVVFGAEEEKIISLTPEQLTGLSNMEGSDGEIVVSVTTPGVGTETAVIDLLAGVAAPAVGCSNSAAQIAMHDGENWIVGKIADLEYSTDGITWTAYTAGHRFEKAQTVQVRYRGHGLTLPGAVTTLTFTDNTPEFTYISKDAVTLVSASGGKYYTNYLNFVHKGEYALDGDPFTNWHSSNGAPKEFVVEFDQVRQFSGFAYTSEGRNGRIRDVEVLVSLDGTQWITAGSASGWTHNNTRKELKLAESISARYVKLIATYTNGNSAGEANAFIAANTLDFYEDTTRQASDATQVLYSTTAPTNGDVVASLLLAQGCTAEEGTVTFTENGSHTFSYTDPWGVTQFITASVGWIDKTAPTAAVTYSTTDITDGPVTATITPSETVAVTNTVNGAHSYEFTANGSFTFQMVDAVGNVGTVTATVDWIIPSAGDMVSFSFSGEHAGKLVLAPFFAGRAATVTYSVYGGEAITVDLPADANKVIALDAAVLNALQTAADTAGGLQVTVCALDGSFEKTHTFQISNGTAPVLMVSGSPNAAAQIAPQDEENHITGKIAGLEYSLDGTAWTSYDPAITRFPGDQTVLVRYGAHDLTRPSGSISLTFTEGNTPSFTYISASRVSLVRASNGQYYQNNRGEYALDGDPFTYWHSANGSPKEFVVKFDQTVNFSGFRYTLLDSSRNGRFLDVEVYTSLDGQTWEQAGSVTGWTWNSYPASNEPKNLILEQPVCTQYVKLVATSTTGAFAAARDIGFYEDTTAPVIRDVSVSKYVQLDSSTMWLVRYAAEPEEGKVLTYDGSPMVYSEAYGAYCYLVASQTLSQEEAAGRIGFAEGTAETVTESKDLNGTGHVDASDAQMVYNLYNTFYNGFTADVTMEKYLQADINGDGQVNIEDATAIISTVLQDS